MPEAKGPRDTCDEGDGFGDIRRQCALPDGSDPSKPLACQFSCCPAIDVVATFDDGFVRCKAPCKEVRARGY